MIEIEAPPASAEKTRHVWILPITAITPSPENAKLYRPVDTADSEVQALADSIRQYGIREPLAVTTGRG
jgi:hypothetical protein